MESLKRLRTLARQDRRRIAVLAEAGWSLMSARHLVLRSDFVEYKKGSARQWRVNT